MNIRNEGDEQAREREKTGQQLRRGQPTAAMAVPHHGSTELASTVWRPSRWLAQTRRSSRRGQQQAVLS
ncbi:hypothetical protein Syun_011692 [Stephania yunnanensis]|uniref:Uncharacterized protein n=1 Tax=Stephania yunnanensis TaxID=152371 RepID=A0AAP0K0F5_9MAGN